MSFRANRGYNLFLLIQFARAITRINRRVDYGCEKQSLHLYISFLPNCKLFKYLNVKQNNK